MNTFFVIEKEIYEFFFILISSQFAVLLIPGANLVLVLRNLCSSGFKAGVLTSLGISLAIFIICLVTVFLPQLITLQSANFLFLRYFGGSYLIFLGCKFWLLSNIGSEINKESNINSKISCYYEFVKTGFLIDILNPYIFIFHLTIFTQFIPKNMGSQLKILGVLVVSFFTFFYFILCSLFFKYIVDITPFEKYSSFIQKISSLILFFLSWKCFFTN